MSDLLRAKCLLYSELLKMYDGEHVVQESDIRLMDALMRDRDIQNYLSRKLSEVK